MAYTTPNTFSDGTVITAADIQENLNALTKYLAQDIVAGDFVTTATTKLRRNNVVKPEYEPLINQMQMVTGVVGSQNFMARNHQAPTGIAAANTGLNNPDEPNWTPVTNSTISFYLEEAATVFFQFYGTAFLPPFNTTLTRADFRIHVDGSRSANTTVRCYSEVDRPFMARYYLSEFWMDTSLAAGYHSIGLVGMCNEANAVLLNWGVCFEAYYT